jgi:hypothetical protein
MKDGSLLIGDDIVKQFGACPTRDQKIEPLIGETATEAMPRQGGDNPGVHEVPK